LNLKFPDIYKDPYHKPEMAITLGEFEALSNFAPFEEIQFFLNNIETLKNIFPE
jgi:mannose-6-phosphate isomerase